MKLVSACIILILLFTSCKKENILCDEPVYNQANCSTDTAILSTLILGKWSWSQDFTVGSGVKINPCNKERDYGYEFFGDGTVNYLEKGVFKEKMYYHFKASGMAQLTIENAVQHQYHAASQTGNFVSICGSYLILDNSSVNQPKTTFRKSD